MKKKKRNFKKLSLGKKVVANIKGGAFGNLPPSVFCQSVDFCVTRDYTICDGGYQCQIFATVERHCR